MSEVAVAKVEPKSSGLGTVKNTDELPIEAAVKILMLSGVVKDGEKAGNVIARLSLGRSLQLPDLQSLGGIVITEKGQVMMSAALMNSLIRRSGKYYLVAKQRDVKGAAIEAFQWIDRHGTQGKGAWISCGVPVTFGPEDAKRAGLDRKETYVKWPVDMYWNRALAALFRAYASDCCSAPVYLPEELDGSGYRTDHETGELVPETARVVQAEPVSWQPTLQNLKVLVTETGGDLSNLLRVIEVKSEADLTTEQIHYLYQIQLKKKKAAPK